MALKDLVAQKAALTEAAIEEVIADYIRYDADAREIIFTPAFAGLSNKAKILVFLTAQVGWQFVVDETVTTALKPAELEEHLGIPGGTLRPTLKDLKDRHLITSKGGEYSARAGSLEAIKSELSGGGTTPKPKARKRNKAKKTVDTSSGDADSGTKPKAAKKASKSANNGAGERFSAWIEDGFFDDERTLKDVQDRFHEVGVIIARTSIPQFLLKAVRVGKLKRTKKKVGNKDLWVYQTA
ncbi:hypothetical protein [Algihabitans albus]|uniref:hypothetical protein n=1 Tax=Algihabitans albus TaxID=2164067 RepID=UPI0013C2CEC2|nr:hypothetical protein [Algihabitans albus]